MKVAVISDIHANLPAFEEVLRDIKHQKAEQIWHLGDFLGYGPFPEQVVQKFRKEGILSIVGNYDLNVLKFPNKKDQWKKKKHPLKYFSFDWTHRQISPSTRQFLKRLPRTKTLGIEGIRILMVHGSPDFIDESLEMDTPHARFTQLARSCDTDVVLCGHSHVFFKIQADGVLFVNPGSVGRPFDEDPRASYALLDIRRGNIRVVNRHVAYDVQKTLRKMKKERFPTPLCQSIALGKSLDRILAEDQEKYINDAMKKVFLLAETCYYEKEHAHQVTRLSLKLFDELKDLHNLDTDCRFLLQAAAILHDIGWIAGGKFHHKKACAIILKDRTLPFDTERRTIVALVARYHRRAFPKENHPYFSEISPKAKRIVKRLAALLRIADGLDRGHISSVQHLKCRVTAQKLIIEIRARNFSQEDREVTNKKAALFQSVFRKKVLLRLKQNS